MVVSNFSATFHDCYESPRPIPYGPKHIVDGDDDDCCFGCDSADPDPDVDVDEYYY